MTTSRADDRPGAASPAQDPSSAPRRRWVDVVGLLARLVLGGVLLVAGWIKVTDITGSIQSVLAYELMGYDLARVVAIAVPVVEVAVGLLLVLGLLTRPAAAVGGVLMVVFSIAVASAWARGLAIDCGCFGTGGPVDPEDTRYLSEILRDLGLLALAGWLVVRPRTLLSLDTLLAKGR
ncbi:DoxX family membrane protein [Ornithinimicrobium humiphilum]|uniref:Methylamine utilization protein MauE n=1 Tax=Ornithinimicrobium humiphilum TaxID=125288 RepID=A0A543KPK9_9MICO|nr:DoxX family protein [Ornithinimicrobium humiphilum]TQM96997.1 methylamine utilization protein MauE [Ornithinimicrobium humiphilum]